VGLTLNKWQKSWMPWEFPRTNWHLEEPKYVQGFLFPSSIFNYFAFSDSNKWIFEHPHLGQELLPLEHASRRRFGFGIVCRLAAGRRSAHEAGGPKSDGGEDQGEPEGRRSPWSGLRLVYCKLPSKFAEINNLSVSDFEQSATLHLQTHRLNAAGRRKNLAWTTSIFWRCSAKAVSAKWCWLNWREPKRSMLWRWTLKISCCAILDLQFFLAGFEKRRNHPRRRCRLHNDGEENFVSGCKTSVPHCPPFKLSDKGVLRYLTN
jgi:hypothetical protein